MHVYDHATWCAKYGRYKAIAERVERSVRRRARDACRAAGLDAELLGIHPHNAMVGLHYGQPWAGVDYSQVRLCLELLERQWAGHRIVRRWDDRVRNLD